MSHWIKGSIALGCSIDILKKALLKINSSWENHIDADPNGQLTMDGRKETYHVILHGSKTNSGSSDVGFRKVDNEKWEMDSYDFYECPNLRGRVTQEVTVMRYEELVRLHDGGEIIESGQKGNKKRLVLRTPVSREYLYEA